MKIEYNLFPNAKKLCLTMSFDDGRIYDRDLIAIFNQYHIKGTFHLNSGFLNHDGYVTKEEVKSLYKGHEVSAHTVTHPHLTNMPKIQVIEEVLKDKAALEELVGYPVRGMSLPFGDYNQEVLDTLKMCGIEYNRTVVSTYKYKKPTDFIEWHPSYHIKKEEPELIQRFLNNPFNEMKILYVWGHSYEFNDNNNWDLIENFCKQLSNREDIWYATNIEIKDYLDALDHLVISTNKNMFYNPSAMDVWVSVDDKPLRIPPKQVIHI